MLEKIRIILPLSEAERATLGAAWAEYDKACGAARSECDKVRGAAWAEYDKACGAAWAEYVKACGAAWAEYDKACGAAWAEYVKAVGGLPLAAWIAEAFCKDYEYEAGRVIQALADSATLDGLRELARVEGWCKVWSDALAAALERFDIVNEVSA